MHLYRMGLIYKRCFVMNKLPVQANNRIIRGLLEVPISKGHEII